MFLIPDRGQIAARHPGRSNAGNISSSRKEGRDTSSMARRVIPQKPGIIAAGPAVVQRMPAGPGLKPPTLLMSNYGVVQIVKETDIGYTVRLNNGSTRDLPYDQLRTSVTKEGSGWEFGFANVDRFSNAAELLAQNKDRISDENWLPDLYRLLTSIISHINPRLPIPKLQPPQYLKGTEEFYGESDMNAQFDHKDWSVAIAPRVFRLKKNEALAEIAGDLFHELRHAEQYFVAARIWAKDYQTSRNRPRQSVEALISQELGLPKEIIDIAVESAKQWKDPTEKELSEGAEVVNALTTSLERGAQTKLEIVKLRGIQQEGAVLIKDIRRDMESIKKIKAGEEPFRAVPPEQRGPTIQLFAGHVKEKQERLAALTLKLNAQQKVVDQIQQEYFNDPTEKDAAALGKEFTAEFSRLAGIKGGEPGKVSGKQPAVEGGKPAPERIRFQLAPVAKFDYDRVIAGIRQDLDEPGPQTGVRGTVFPGYNLSQAQIAALGGRTVLPTVPDGDCFINAVFESLGRPGDPRTLRAELAGEARRRGLVDARGAETLLQPGDWTLSNIALPLIAQAMRIRINILRADGNFEAPIGSVDAESTIVLVHIPGAKPHYYGTRP